ncbi:hypothetical protein BKA69DRAFT_902204 [Paraphysoderma sedebokerense]|nr:hypothetical protein BKA69DRAFT_902204 [Paraphysoderma sedebokerense]
MLTCFRSLIYLGDLARYREQLNDKPVKTYAVAKSYYKEALTIAPEHGNPHNQLAVVATYLQDELSAVYHYYRSLIVRQPFLTAKDNLGLLFQQSLKKFFSTLESSGDGVQSELERKDSKYSESKLSDGLDGLADDTRADQEALEKLTKKFISSLVNVQGLIYLKKNLDKLPSLASDTLHHFRRLLHHRALAAPQLLMITITSLSSMYGILYIDEKLAPSLPKSKPQQSKSESSSTSAATTSPELLQSARNLALKFVLEMALILVNVSNDAFMRPPSPTEKDDSEELVGIPPIVKRILPSLKIMTAWLGFSIDEIPSYLNSSSPPSSSTSSASSDTSAALSTDDSSSQSVSSTVATLLIQILQSYRTLTKHLKTVRDTLSVPPETDIQKLHFPQSTAYMVQAFTPLKEDYEIFGFKPMQKYLDAISFLEPSSPSTTSTPTSNPTSEKTSTATRSDSVSTGQATPTPTSSVSCILPLSTLKSALTRRKLVFAALTPYQEALIRIHTIIASTEMMIPKLKDVVAKLDKDAVIPESPKKSGVTGLPEVELTKFKFNGSNGPFDLPTSAEIVATGQRSHRQGEMKTHRGSDRRGLTEDGEVDEDQIFAALVSNVAKRGLDDDDKADNSREDEILFRPGRNQSVFNLPSVKQLINSNEPASSLPPPPAQATHRNSLSSIWGFNESIQKQPSGHQSNIIDNQSNSQSYSQVQQLQALSSLFQPLPSATATTTAAPTNNKSTLFASWVFQYP